MTRFDGLDEGVGALRYILSHIGLFVKTAGLWSIIVGAYSWLVLHSHAYAIGVTTSVFSPMAADDIRNSHLSPTFVLFGLFLAHHLLWLIAACAVAVTYHRRVLENYATGWPLAPLNRRWLRYFGKIFFASVMINQMAQALVSGTVFHTTPLPESISSQVEGIVGWFVLSIASLYGLVLPATAVNNRTMDFLASGLATRGITLPYIGGFLLSSLPLIIAAGYLGRLHPFSPVDISDIASLITSILETTLYLAAIASNAVYLSRAYQMLSPTFAEFPES